MTTEKIRSPLLHWPHVDVLWIWQWQKRVGSEHFRAVQDTFWSCSVYKFVERAIHRVIFLLVFILCYVIISWVTRAISYSGHPGFASRLGYQLFWLTFLWHFLVTMRKWCENRPSSKLPLPGFMYKIMYMWHTHTRAQNILERQWVRMSTA
jgi:hypothetical protein